MTDLTPPTPPELTVHRTAEPLNMTWTSKPRPAPGYRVLVSLDCSDCRQPWWHKLDSDPLPTVCPACIAYRTKPWWRRAINRLARKADHD